MNVDFKNMIIGVANRGIPALRVGRTIQEMEAIHAAFFTPVDKTAPHVSKANRAYSLSTVDGYLDIEEIVRVAKKHKVVALHPGWGFAAEDNRFPSFCQEHGIIFIGPSEEPMRKLGNKVMARKIAKSLSIPIIEGSDGAVSLEDAKRIGETIGFPLMIKSEGGGGGRGGVVVNSQEELDGHFFKASSMAEASFGNPNLYIEQYLPYLMTAHIEPGEQYTYGSRIHDQIAYWTDVFKKTPNTNQAVLQVARPEDYQLDDPPCLRQIDMRIKDDVLLFYPYFRSWDLWAGFPANLAGIAVMQKTMADDIGIAPGPIIASSKGLHIYGYVEELAKLRTGK